jgi:hypothetical protein
MWVLLAVISALLLGVYDIFKKISVSGNNVLTVLFLNTMFGAFILSPFIFDSAVNNPGTLSAHAGILLKSFIVLSAWILGYFGVKHMPLTITGPINATRPVLVLAGALLIFHESLNIYQWVGISVGFLSLFLISKIGAKEGFSVRDNKWIWFCIGSAVMGAVSGLYDKYLLQKYEPLFVQSWYALYQFLIMGITIFIIKRTYRDKTKFIWRWSIPCIALFLTLADLAYFYALSIDGAMISVISMLRRGSVIIPFIYGVTILKERNVKLKLIDLTLLMIGLAFLVIGSR